uniref:Uncharacterized protein n=1 Tax=Trichogramma kaykai TaxID=54128 RepID=A0ABD2W5S5_9HYME
MPLLVVFSEHLAIGCRRQLIRRGRKRIAKFSRSGKVVGAVAEKRWNKLKELKRKSHECESLTDPEPLEESASLKCAQQRSTIQQARSVGSSFVMSSTSIINWSAIDLEPPQRCGSERNSSRL